MTQSVGPRMKRELIEEILREMRGGRFVYFREYKGPGPKRSWNRKPIVGPPDRPFAELQYVQRLEQEGWTAGWCFRPNQYISTWEPEKRAVQFPRQAQQLMAEISARAGSTAGCWDVFAWKDGSPHFAELKRLGSPDKLRETQVRWRAAALDLGVPDSSFHEIKWIGGSLDGYSLMMVGMPQRIPDAWIRYRAGKFESGGRNAHHAEFWLEGYRRDTGLDGADLLWVLCYQEAPTWNLVQVRDRKARTGVRARGS